MIEVVGLHQHGHPVLFKKKRRVGEEKLRVGLQMHRAAISEEPPVALEEECRRQTLTRVLHLRVAERQPDLLHLTGRKEAVDNLNIRSQKGHVRQVFLKSLLGPCPHSRPFDVYPDKVYLREQAGETYRVFSLATPQLQNDGTAIVEIRLTPAAAHRFHLSRRCRIRTLEDVGERFHLSKLL